MGDCVNVAAILPLPCGHQKSSCTTSPREVATGVTVPPERLGALGLTHAPCCQPFDFLEILSEEGVSVSSSSWKNPGQSLYTENFLKIPPKV